MTKKAVSYQTIESTIGIAPIVRLVNLPGEENKKRNNVILAKLEGASPSGSGKDRSMHAMVRYAEERGEIRPGDTLVEATSGNAGVALAMIATVRGYHCILVMPENTPIEKQRSMVAFGAKIILTPRQSGMSFARNLVAKMVAEGRGITLDQYANPDNPRAHYETTGPEIWKATQGRVTHVICGIGTTGTIMGVSQYLKEQSEKVQIIGVEPEGGGRMIPGMSKWSESMMPGIYDKSRVDRMESVSLAHAEYMTRRLVLEEGLFCGISSGATGEVALKLSQEVENATIVFIVADRGERYLSLGVFQA